VKKKALVTGASEGIGRAIAKKLASENYSLTLVARNQERLETLVKELPEANHKIFIADLSSNTDVLRLADLFSETHYDLLINNAGHGAYGVFRTVPMENLLHMFRVNCESLLILSHAFLEHAKTGDALVNVSSTLAFLPMASSASYCATKSFVTALSEAVWVEEKKRGVYVMNLCPGLTKTEFMKRAGGRADAPPPSMFQSAEMVAEEMFRELKKRKNPTVITGRQNRAFALVSRMLSRKNVAKVMGSVR
jgi:short-subunit dehydrogenase